MMRTPLVTVLLLAGVTWTAAGQASVNARVAGTFASLVTAGCAERALYWPHQGDGGSSTRILAHGKSVANSA